MKYLKALYFLAQVAAVCAVIIGAAKGVCLLCAAVTPLLGALLAWLGDHAIVIAVLIVIGFFLWIFGDICDEQVEKERGR